MKTKETWKPVAIGGLTGILMGAGAMYGVQSVASESNVNTLGAEENLKVATVDDSMSFKEAFETARAQVGAGGVFTWHGKIFNTYTAEEWKAMSNDDKQLFAEQVKPQVPATEIDTKQVAELTIDDDVQVVSHQDHDVETTAKPEDVQLHTTTWNELAQEENDVRVVGFKDVEYGNGRSAAMQELDINGQRVAVIDVDKDGDPDLAMTDLNHDNQIEEGEVIDLHTGEAISFANDDPSVESAPELDIFTV